MAGVYDLVVIGAGSAGLTAATFGLETGAKVALVERDRIGGDCTWTGCVPSKSLLRSAQVAHTAFAAGEVGLNPAPAEVPFDQVMQRVHHIVHDIYDDESPEVLREMGIDVYLGEAHFVGRHRIAVGDEVLNGRAFVIATGARPFVPPIEGLKDVHYYTSDTLWDLERRPDHLVVIGGGPIGCEMSQAFRRLGAEVTLLEARDRLLIHDEPEAAAVLTEVLRSEGVKVRFGHRVEGVGQDGDRIHVQTNNGEVVGDTLLVAVGRRPNVGSLDLDGLGIAYSERGLDVDDHLRTSEPHIYAAGDCLGHFQFTHYADWQGRVAARNALLPGVSKGRRDTVPWTTFTEPEVAHAGLTESQARERYGDDVAAAMVSMGEVDRARAEGTTRGFIKVVHRGGKVLGVTIVSERAGENITEWVHVIDGRLSVMDVATAIHVYPTYSRGNIRAAGQVLSARLRAGPLSKAVDVLSSAALGWMRWWHASGRSEDGAEE